MRWNQLTSRKNIDELVAELAEHNPLRRALGPVSLTALGVGCIIGAGIFVMTGRAAAEDAGPAIVLSYMVAGLGCALAALCYAEFASMAPVAGSAYTYAYASLGELCAWIIGWDLILEYAMACACVAAGWAQYLNEFLRSVFGVSIDPRWCSDPFSNPEAYFNLPAVGIMVVVTIILIIGIRESAATNTVLTIVKLAVVLFVIGLGFMLVNQTQNNWTDVPHYKRLTTAEIATKGVVSRMVLGDTPSWKATPEQLAQIEADTKYVRARLSVEKAEASLAASPADSKERDKVAADVESARAELDAASKQVKDPARFDKLLADLQTASEEATAEKWGMVAAIIDPATLKPLDDAVRTNFTPYGFSGIMLGAAIVFFAFIGFDSISTHAEEAINPQRNVPIAIIASLAICTVLYVLVAAVITGMEPYYQINTEAAIAAAFRKQAELHDSGLLRMSTIFIATGALAGLTSVLLVTFLSQVRVFLAMARDRLLPPAIFGAVHPRFKTPHIATALTGFVICVTAAFTPISDLEKMVNIGTLFAFVVVCITVLVLRFQNPGQHRPFRCPLIYLVAPLGIAVNVSMMMFLPVSTWLRLVIWMAAGLVLYFAYGYRHSRMREAAV